MTVVIHFSGKVFQFYFMLWITLFLFISILGWLLLSPLEVKIDTRVPMTRVRWKNVGNATLFYEDDQWWLEVFVLFFSKKWNLMQISFTDRKKKKKAQSRRKKNRGKSTTILKFFKILKTFQIVQWEIAFSADDNTKNAYWYWLNFFPLTRRHVHINFIDENYLVFVIRNKAWQIAYAYIK
jgi:hypothetical protein